MGGRQSAPGRASLRFLRREVYLQIRLANIANHQPLLRHSAGRGPFRTQVSATFNLYTYLLQFIRKNYPPKSATMTLKLLRLHTKRIPIII